MRTERPWPIDLLWPTADGATAHGPVRAFTPVPSDDPTQFLPEGRAAFAGLRSRRSDDRSTTRTTLKAIAGAVLAAGALLRSRRVLVPSTGDIVASIANEIGVTPRACAVLCGPRRANQKPVLQLLDRRLEPVAYVKIGWNDLTQRLLEQERQALSWLTTRPPSAVRVPAVLGHGTHDDLDWLAVSAIDVREHRATRGDDVPLSIARAVEATGIRWSGTFTASPYLTLLRPRARGLVVASGAIDALTRAIGSIPLDLAGWHGDFTPWNLLTGVDTTALWDWERYDRSVPTGLDRLHYALQIALTRQHLDELGAVASVRAQLPRLLPELEHTAAVGRLASYLVEILVRYEADLHVERSDALARRVPQLARALHQVLEAS
jgi:hypothetical protein